MRFDDTFDTVLAADRMHPTAMQAAWRQIVDLVGRGRVPADARALDTLERLRAVVPLSVRAASARALSDATPPMALLRLLVADEMAVAGPVLRTVQLSDEEWQAIVPLLSPAGRAVLRHRRDLPGAALVALASFGSVDFVIAGTVGEVTEVAPAKSAAYDPTPPAMVDTSPFVAVGKAAHDVLVRARAHGNDDVPPPAARPDGTFRIADVVARIEAYRRRRDEPAESAAAMDHRRADRFQFETDSTGIIRSVAGVSRGALIGLSLARPANPGNAGVDGIVAGAFRKRSRFDRARLLVGGRGESAGDWTITGVPSFEPRSGRFIGYRGSARRPRSDERAQGVPTDALRELVHELRTPASAISGFSEMIEHEMLGPVAAPYRTQASAIRTEAGALLAAIDDIDTVARLKTGALMLRRHPVDLEPMLLDVAERLAPLVSDRGATLKIVEAGGTVVTDGPTLDRMLTRLIATMVGAAGAGETIAVELRDRDKTTIRISVDRPAALAHHVGDAVLDIEDETSPASLLGTGFALRLVRNLAIELGGSLKFGDRRLTLRLPAALDPSMEQVHQS